MHADKQAGYYSEYLGCESRVLNGAHVEVVTLLRLTINLAAEATAVVVVLNHHGQTLLPVELALIYRIRKILR